MGRNLEGFIRDNFDKALLKHEIQPFYQPVVRTSSRKLCSFEALARWIDPEIGTIFPDEFIPVLEGERVINRLDESILHQVCARMRGCITGGEAPVPVSVNLSRLDFTLCDVFSVMDNIISDYQIPHDLICFEVTESVMAEQKEQLKVIVDQFRSAGYQVWMDDFGSAYSSLNILKDFSFDEIKLDMLFTRPFNLRSKRIVTSAVEMAKRIGIHTLAEGVETEEQFNYFRNIGCEKIQGYYFGKPLPYDEAVENMKAQGIETEEPQDRPYYDEIGKIDFLSSVPFMTKEEYDSLVTARQLNSIPLALAEFSEDYFSVLFYNSAFEKTAEGTGLISLVFTQEMLCRPQPYNHLSAKIINLMDSVKSGGDGRMLFTYKENYYEVFARNIASTHDRYCVLIRITDLTKDRQTESTGYLDDFSRRIYALFERITLVNVKEDTIMPLYTATRRDLLSGRRGVKMLGKEYAEKYIYPEDRDKYISEFDPDNFMSRLKQTYTQSVTLKLRASIRHGQYAWKEFTALKIDDDRYLMLIRDVDESAGPVEKPGASEKPAAAVYSPEHLWHELVHSDLLRIFWKDRDRRFIGASKAFLDYYDFKSADEIIGKNDEELGWHIHPDKYMNDELKVIREGVTTHNIPGLCTNEGENKEILASKAPLYDSDGTIQGLMGYFIDRELLTVNDKRGKETPRRDMLTGLLNFKGITEEAVSFRDVYYLRGVDFARMHIEISDFAVLNKEYGYEFGDKILIALGKAIKQNFGRTCAVGRYAGHHFIVLHQVKDVHESEELKERIKKVGASIKSVDGVPVTLYLSMGIALYSEAQSLEQQEKLCDVRLHEDYDNIISADMRIAHPDEMFKLFDDLPISYCVYHVTLAEHSGEEDAVIYYVNKKYLEYGGHTSREAVFGHSVRELYPDVGEDWFRDISRAAFNGESVHGDITFGGNTFSYTARQIIYPGYCAVTYLESPGKPL